MTKLLPGLPFVRRVIWRDGEGWCLQVRCPYCRDCGIWLDASVVALEPEHVAR